jgi:DNA-binding NarL/FixJ family response regulator
MNILIVDDSAAMRQMIRKLIEPLAREISECADADEAVTSYQLNRPDWVLMDLRLGRKDGITATQQICKTDPTAKVVIVTNYDDRELRAAAFDAGACAYILKDNLYKLPEVLRNREASKSVEPTCMTQINLALGVQS